MTLKIRNGQAWTRTNIKNRCITGITLQKKLEKGKVRN